MQGAACQGRLCKSKCSRAVLDAAAAAAAGCQLCRAHQLWLSKMLQPPRQPASTAHCSQVQP